ncbi:hypothetical protein BDN72DRAFT_731654, partial [Pluteus cervinus]
RCKRWQEEVILLKEEMRRVLMFLDSSASMWKARAEFQKEGVDEACQEGLRAYALEQRTLRTNLYSHFTELW